ncbi:MAG: WecB/TagA/CpsF family glycosyltransferase [Kineothrix sp.]|nr:WecB/TagA/CpsF family glycosyltransferase [Kineothrix sp.]
MQNLNILGVALTDYSLKESLFMLDEFVKGGGLKTILYITTPMLIMAGEDAEEKNAIEAMDMTLCGDADILRVAGIKSASRQYEVDNLVFLKEFLRRMVRNDRKIYLLAESEGEIKLLREDLEALQNGVLIGGSSVAAEVEDEIINRINDIAPTAVISRMPSGRQERWMMEAKLLVNAEVWLGISKDMIFDRTKEPLSKKVMDKVYKKIFQRRMNRFNDGSEKGE